MNENKLKEELKKQIENLKQEIETKELVFQGLLDMLYKENEERDSE